MDFEKIKDLMKTLDNSNLMDFELKLNDGFYLRMNKHQQNIKQIEQEDKSILNEQNIPNQILKDDIKIEENFKKEPKKEIKSGNIITSPIVGTFYASSSPSKPPFVKLNDKVKQGDTIGIIEAMKVMNEIKSQFDGEIVEILVSNEDMVEYGQPLFRVI